MTLQEILKEYGFTGLPKGTTEQQWIDYHNEVIEWKKYADPKRASGEWSDMDYHCMMPNRPGYEIANND